MLDDSLLVKPFPALLKALRARIASLPASLPLGDADSYLACYLGNLTIDSEGATFTANRQWERAFQVSPEELQKRIVRGKYGLDLVCPFLDYFSQQGGIKGTVSIGMLARRIHQLNKILDSVPGLTPDVVEPSQFFAPKTKKTSTQSGTSSLVPAKRAQAPDSEDDVNDKSYQLPKNPLVVSEEDSDAPQEMMPPTSAILDYEGKTKGTVNAETHKAPEAQAEPEQGEEDAPKTKAGGNPKRSRWAISNYTSPPTIGQSTKGSPVWRWQCKWCSDFRTSARTKGCTKFEDGTIELVVDSNFHSHLPKCKGMPPEASFEAYADAETTEMTGTRPVPVAGTSSIALQRQSMTKFIQDGIENPAVVVTKRGFRERLIKGIALDDLPYLLPRGWKIPGRKTDKADITKLSALLRDRVTALVLNNSSKFAMAEDLWTSKNSVYAFCGSVGWLIDDEWRLREFVLDLLPLDGDHSDAASVSEKS
ncbi:hypothetical protein FB451DRAFT_1193328 [Mycena latifolia]|nr:hypothetical protein FB451DRAFT_1193328 [Mycena latifolia]